MGNEDDSLVWNEKNNLVHTPMQTLGSTVAEAFPSSSVSNVAVCDDATVFFE
jgi:hypothetical protein